MDAVLESLTKEAGNYGKRAGEAFPRITPEVQAARDAEAQSIRTRELMPDGGGMVKTSSVIQGSGAPPAAPQDPVMASLMAEASGTMKPATTTPGGRLSDQIPGHTEQPEYKEVPAWKRALGIPEANLSMLTGAVAAPVAAVGALASGLTGANPTERFKDIMGSLTYRPRTEGGAATLETFGKVIDDSKIAGLNPTTGSGASAGRAAMAGAKPGIAAEVAAVPGQMASVGAAGVKPSVQAATLVANASPELQAATQAAIKKLGNNVNLDVLKRHIEADSLPVPVPLTKGQATQDVVILSKEQIRRAAGSGEAAKRFNEQNKALIENTNAIREQAAPDVFVSSKPATGEIIIDAYKAKDAALNTDISAKYKALKDANGGQFPLHAKAFVDAADEALHKNLLFDHVPAELRSTLNRLRQSGSTVGGGMTFENFESLRTNLARIQRSPSADGNAKAAAGIIRQSLEDLPMPPGAEHLKPLADTARNAARGRFALIESDPAYKAVVTGKASADKFIDKFIIGADLKNLQTLKSNLAADPTATQAVASGTINHLKSAAGIIDDTGNFSQAGYNRSLEKIRPKLEVIFEPKQRQQVETLGNVARYTQAQPRGSFVNNSNTLVGAIGEQAANTAEGVANVAAHGVPIGTWARRYMSGEKDAMEIRRMLEPGAGLMPDKVRAK